MVVWTWNGMKNFVWIIWSSTIRVRNSGTFIFNFAYINLEI